MDQVEDIGAKPLHALPALAAAWQEADQLHYDSTHSKGLDSQSITPWYNDAGGHIVGDHPVVVEENDSEFAPSDHSNFIASDTDSRDSSFSAGPLAPNHDIIFPPDLDWRNFPVTWNSQGQVMLLPPSGSDATNDTRHVENIFKSSSIDNRIPTTVNPAAFHNSPIRPRLTGQVRAYPSVHLLSPPPSNDGTHIALSELKLPYIPQRALQAHTNLGSSSGSRATASAPSLRGGIRGTTTRGRGRASAIEARKRNRVKPYPTPAVKKPVPSKNAASSPTLTVPNTTDESTAASDERSRRSASVRYNVNKDSDDAGESDVTDSDVYSPSRSPSPASSPSEYSDNAPIISYRQNKASKATRKKKISQMSAADALAQVSRSNSASGSNRDVDMHADSADGSLSGASVTSSSPISVPRVNKASRGRKVPHVSDRLAKQLAAEDASDGGSDDGAEKRVGSRRVGRGRGGGKARGRSFVCTVEGCGKCFVRAEHLKRHVRSIHMEDKPHKCPYRGCGKSFSRRDNLGQHVRLHLIGSG